MDIKQFSAIIWRQRAVVCAVLLVGVAVFALVATKSRKYTATATVLAVSPSPQDAAVLDPSKDPTQSAIALADVPNLLASSTLVAQVGRDLHLSRSQTQRLATSIKAKPSLGSDVLPVTVTDGEPKRAIAEVNAVVRELQKYEQRIATSRYDLLIDDLNAQLADRRSALANVDHQIDALTGDDPFVNDQTGNAALSARLVALQAQRDQVQATMRGDASAATLVAQRPALTRDLASQEILKDDAVVQSLRTQYGKDLAQLDNERASYTDKFPGLAGYNKAVAREGNSLADVQAQVTANPSKSTSYVAAQLDQNKAEATLAGDQAQLDTLNAQIAGMQAHFGASRAESMSLAGLRRDRDAGNQAYAQLSDRLAVAQADRAQSASINTIVLLDSATAAAPTLLSQPPVIAAALAAIFLWLAITLALVVDSTDSRLRTRTTIEDLYGSRVFTAVG